MAMLSNNYYGCPKCKNKNIPAGVKSCPICGAVILTSFIQSSDILRKPNLMKKPLSPPKQLSSLSPLDPLSPYYPKKNFNLSSFKEQPLQLKELLYLEQNIVDVNIRQEIKKILLKMPVSARMNYLFRIVEFKKSKGIYNEHFLMPKTNPPFRAIKQKKHPLGLGSYNQHFKMPKINTPFVRPTSKPSCKRCSKTISGKYMKYTSPSKTNVFSLCNKCSFFVKQRMSLLRSKPNFTACTLLKEACHDFEEALKQDPKNSQIEKNLKETKILLKSASGAMLKYVVFWFPAVFLLNIVEFILSPLKR